MQRKTRTDGIPCRDTCPTDSHRSCSFRAVVQCVLALQRLQSASTADAFELSQTFRCFWRSFQRSPLPLNIAVLLLAWLALACTDKCGCVERLLSSYCAGSLNPSVSYTERTAARQPAARWVRRSNSSCSDQQVRLRQILALSSCPAARISDTSLMARGSA